MVLAIISFANLVHIVCFLAWLLLASLFQSASQVRSGHFAAGFADGSIRIFDVRTPDR